jgi:hypothetical protein
MSVQETLEMLRKAGTPAEWDASKGYMLLDFAPPHDIDRVRAAPPVETVGVLLSAESVPELLKAVGDVWHVRIDAAQDLIARIDAYNTAHRAAEKDLREATAEWTQQAYPGYGRYGQTVDADDDAEPEQHSVEFKAIKRLDFDGLVHGLAQSLGGEARDMGANKWQIAVIADPAKEQAELTRLKTTIDAEFAGNTSTGFTSFAMRSGAESGAGAEVEAQPVPIPEVSEDVAAAFECLGSYGKSAMPILTAYLDPEKPQAARQAAETLAAIDSAESRSALGAFTNKLRTPCKDKTANAMRPELLDLMIRLVARDAAASHDSRDLLAAIALDEKTPQDVRSAARMAVVQNGDTSPFAGSPASQMTGGEMDQLVRYPPEPGRPQPMQTASDPNTIIPLADARTPSDDVWAVFLSGRLGNANDLWLAHGQNHKWVEFLFTGKMFTTQNGYGGYGNGVGPSKGACTLAVNGDQIVISPPNKNLTGEIARLTTLMQDPKLTPEKRNTLSQQYQRAAQQAANVLDKPISLTLADLRKDSDADGLPDLVEKRLGLDPHNPDTDGDGIKDGQDANPLVGPESAKTGRGKILQMVFEALYGKDMSPDPILVVLDRENWQEFYGAHARVICITHHDLIANAMQLGSLRILQFGGPKDASATILQKDGPALFNDGRTRAEVHFWRWIGANSMDAHLAQQRRQYGQQVEVPREYIAQFDNGPNWKMTSLKPSKADTADKAAPELSAAIAAGQYGRVD